MITPERHRQISDLFHAALAMAPEKRPAFLTEACTDDEWLRREVESLLAHESRKGFLSTPAAALADAFTTTRQSMMGRQVGPYAIHARLGAGGMGEVYRARDTTLGRDVAIKILPRTFSSDPERRARFDREARLLASLNHPHIGAIYGVEDLDGAPALILELVEGDTLADRLARGPIAIGEALNIARQIADALEAAHERGIIHRDLKPANIQITPEGIVKVLDFGLAKAATGDASGPDLTQSPTVTNAGTHDGVILGTAAYMSPEQARGKPVDKRTDIWAFGCVLYEMLTGCSAFRGESVADTVARVLEREPEWGRLPANLPARVHELLRRCLEKDPRNRRRDIGDVRLEIEHSLSEPAQVPGPLVARAATRRGQFAWIAAAILTVALAVALARPYFSTPPEAPETRVDIGTPETPDPTGFAISSDGRRLVFVAFRNGQAQLYVRSLDADTAQPLSGTEGATHPFWSPDGRSIGFFATGQLRRIDIEGGLLQTLAQAVPGQGGTWGPDGTILFAPTQTGTLFRVPASNGEPVAVTKIGAGQSAHGFPWLLPGGRQFLFYVAGTGDARGIYLGSLDSLETRRLTDADSPGAYAPPGWLLFERQGALVARRFDPARREISGDPVTVAESVAPGGHGGFSASATGVLAYRTGETNPRQLTWFNRSGRALGTLGEPDRAGLLNAELSRDGGRAAVQRRVQNNVNIWLIDSARTTRFTFDTGLQLYPVWSPDGARIAFAGSRADLYQRVLSGDGSDELLFSSPQLKFPSDWSADGRFLMYFAVNTKASPDLWVLPMDGDRKPFLFLGTNFSETWGQFSPDGRWVAYQSNESGRFEIYVRPFPGPGGQWPISSSGGVYPRWSPDGKELYYLASNGTLMATSIAVKGATLAAGPAVTLFQPRIVGGGAFLVGSRPQYDVAPDGRFLINTETESGSPPVTLVMNWRPRVN